MTATRARRPNRGRRPRILFAWELGANYGHASQIVETVVALGSLADVFVAAREPQAFAALAPDLGVVIRPAPSAPRPPPPPIGPASPVLSYPDALRFCGWGDADQLAALIRSWRAVFEDLTPDLIVAQAAPTALLAARGGPFAVATLGAGYDAPARAEPMPPFPGDFPLSLVQAAEEQTLRIAEAALRATGGTALGRFRALFDAGPVLLAAMIQTDHYHPRRVWEPDHPPYLGQVSTRDKGWPLDWAADGRARVFAYLRPGAPGFAATTAALEAKGRAWDAVLAAPGIASAAADTLRAAGVQVVDGPARLDRLLPGAELVISHGSNGLVAASLVAGVPQLLLPTQTEQVMLARTVVGQKVALALAGRPDGPAVGRAIETALGSAALRAMSKAVAATIAATGTADPAGAVAARLLAVAADA